MKQGLQLRTKKTNFYFILIILTLTVFQLNIIKTVSSQASATIVINEIYYDPTSNDLGNEWIELYNPSNVPVSLANWVIQSAGTSFSTEYVIPSGYIIKPNNYFLIGNNTDDVFSNVAFDIEVSTFTFQNGGSAADGVRILDSSGSVIDAVIYAGQNINSLEDKSGSVASLIALDAPAGHSLSRYPDGIDTGDVTVDFIDLTYPTPTSGGDYDNQAPQIVNQNNKTLPEGTQGYKLMWNATDKYPDNYSIKQDGVEISSGTWNSTSLINVNLDNLALTLGIHNFTITIADISGNKAYNTVSVTIIDDILPEINHPDDMNITQDVQGNFIAWNATDNHSGSYELYKNGSKIDMNTWNSGTNIQYSLNGLPAGYFNFTIVVYDSSGNTVSDTVMVTVNSAGSQVTNSTNMNTNTNTNTNTGSDTSELSSGSISVEKSSGNTTDGFNLIMFFLLILFASTGNRFRKRKE